MRKLFAIAAFCVVGMFVGCDSESSTASGGQPGTATAEPSGIVGQWIKTQRSGQIKSSNTVYTFRADGSYLKTQIPPLDEKSYFYRDSGTWSAFRDTLKIVSNGFTTSFDSGKTWTSDPPGTFYRPYQITGNQLILTLEDDESGSDVYEYFVRKN
ncbi:MAG: hypothetical protein IPN71_17625 [Fibrobacteres bacterium]|nr:hypothetical protein [Fibrobacterota bacterium]